MANQAEHKTLKSGVMIVSYIPRTPQLCYAQSPGLSCANPGSMVCLRKLEIALTFFLTMCNYNEGTKVGSTTPEPGRAVERTHR